jgi:hypothetical protein
VRSIAWFKWLDSTREQQLQICTRFSVTGLGKSSRDTFMIHANCRRLRRGAELTMEICAF